LSGMELQSALEFSNAAAALNCTAIGARGHIPTRGEVEDLLSAASRGGVARHNSPEIRARFEEIAAVAR
jgi:hypothetical protein